MKLSTGMIEIPIEFDNGDVASVSIRPNDRDIRRRIDEFSQRVEQYAAKLISEKNLLKFADGGAVGGVAVGGGAVGGGAVGDGTVGGAVGDVAVGGGTDAETAKLLAEIADGSIDIDDIFALSPEKLRALNYGADAAEKIEDAFNTAVEQELDRVFGSPVSNVLFRYCRPLDRCDGDVYVNVAIKLLAAEIKNRSDNNLSSLSPKAQGRIEKYRNRKK